jgi:hypothetical protein
MANDQDLKTTVLTYIDSMQDLMRQLNEAIEQDNVDVMRDAYDAVAAKLEAMKAELADDAA